MEGRERMAQLQAHRGVSTEYPENTLPAFRAAVRQGYDLIELDPNYTSDGKLVVLHDDSINRVARHGDGSALKEQKNIHELTFAEAAAFDYGLWFSPKFRGVKLPLLADVFALAEEWGVTLKLDNKIWGFPEAVREQLLHMVEETGASVALTCGDMDSVRRALKTGAAIHYDGAADEESLQRLAAAAKDAVVWLPYECPQTSWVTVPFASKERCALVKQYARLGIWLLSEYRDCETACRELGADVVETNGSIKPVRNRGFLADMHTHSRNSHDSKCPVAEMALKERQRGMKAFAVTDHFDMVDSARTDLYGNLRNSAKEVTESRDGHIQILTGVEVGHEVSRPEDSLRVLEMQEYDVVLGSVHTVAWGPYERTPYSLIDFSRMSGEERKAYLHAYFEQVRKMLETVPCDIMAHLTCPLRYITGKYGIKIDLRQFRPQIEDILRYIIDHGIALEINTSGLHDRYDDFLPQEELVKLYREMGGYLVTLGSDAHVSERAANGFDRALEMLRRNGFRNIFYYQERDSIPCALG